jgi:hypothetical protein
MKTLRVRLTRPDHATTPAGIIMRVAEDRFGPGEHEYMVHNFSRKHGSQVPTDFFWGHYHNTEEKALAAFNEKVERAKRWTTGGSLIPDALIDAELEAELEQETTLERTE